MSGILKVLGIAVAAVLILLLVAMAGVSLVFDPNDYKDDIAAAVEDATGRELGLEGDLELEIFPRLRIAIGAAELANAQGFGDAPFARIEGARLQVGLLPILFGRIEIDEARLEGLVLNLARNAQGQANWEDLGAPDQTGDVATEPEPDAAEDAALDLDVGAIVIADAEVNWLDSSTGSQWQLGGFSMEAAGFGPNQAFPLSTEFEIAGEELRVAVAATMEATLQIADSLYRLEDLEIGLTGEGAAWPGGEGEVALSFSAFEANLESESIRLDELTLEILGITINGGLEGRQLFGDLTLGGAIEIEAFDPQEVLDALSIELVTADPDALRRVAANGQFAYDANQQMLQQLQLELDDSRMTGELGLVGDALRFDLEVDEINIDRYLPPASEGESSDEGSLDEVDLPLDVLGTLEASGRLAAGAAQFIGLSLSDVEFLLSADGGTVTLSPQASLYGGELTGEIGVRVQGDTALISLEQELTGVDSAPLGQDLLDSQMVSGMVNANLDLTANGSNLGEVRRQLDGDVSFALTDGAWNGVDMWYELRRARAVFDQRPTPERDDAPATTPFSEVSVSGVVEDGVMSTQSLMATLPFMAVTGSGTVSLITDAMDFDVTATMTDGPVLQSDPEMVDLAGDELPFTVGGTLSEPSVLPDFAAMVRAEAEERIEEEIEEETEELRDRLEDRLRGIFNR